MRLTDFAADTYSQFGEDGMIAYIFSRIGEGGRVCVEFGANDGTSCSNTAKLWRDSDWTAILIEGDKEMYQNICLLVARFRGRVRPVLTFLAPTGPCTVDNVLSNNSVDRVDFMSIDVDGIDYAIWEAMECRPRVVCIEYNQSIPPHISLWQKSLDDQLGSSAKAIVELATSKGYALVGMNKANLFFVVIEEYETLKHLTNKLDKIFPYEGLSYAATDYRGRPFVVGNPPWGLLNDPYIGETEGDTIAIMGTVANMLHSLEQDYGHTPVFIGQDWEVSPAAPTEIGIAAYERLFGSNYPVVVIDIANQSSIEGCMWVADVATKFGYDMRTLGKAFFVFTKRGAP